MGVRLDMEERIFRAFRELLEADTDIYRIAGERVWMYGDASHKAEYPCVLVNIPASTVSGMMELGWYEIHVQLLAAVYRPDDKDLSFLRELEGYIRGFCQQTNLPALLTATRAATRASTQLTVVDARIENDVPDEEGQQTQIYAGTSLMVTCAPYNENVRPSPSPSGSGNSGAADGGGGGNPAAGEGESPAQPIENNDQTGD